MDFIRINWKFCIFGLIGLYEHPSHAEIEALISIILFCGWNYRQFKKQLKGKSKFWKM